MGKKYELGVMDLYPIMANKTLIENNPYLQAILKENVQYHRLYEAVKATLNNFPLFGCTMRYKDGNYFLESLDNDFILLNVAEGDRPLEFGDNTKGYLWQICYDKNNIIFEWCHAITDGRGAFAFFSAILCHYFGVPKEVTPKTELGLESFYDKDEKGIPQKEQEPGHKASTLPYIKRGYKTDCHILKAPMKEILMVAKKNDASPAAVLPPLYSMAMRKHMKPSVKNKNVRCNVCVDCRVPMKFETMHNCILFKNITYIDKFDTMDFSVVSTIYRAIIDLAVQKENIINEATKTVDDIRRYAFYKPRFLRKSVAKRHYASQKHSENNFTFTYLGKMDLPKEVMEGLEDFYFRSWTDFGECNMAAIDVNGTMVINLCENYKDKGVVADFIKLCKEQGINFEEVKSLPYEQANTRLKAL